MAFILHPGNRLEDLARDLAALLNDGKGNPDPLVTDLVIVPGQAMERWLSLELARNASICAGLLPLFPGDFFQRFVFSPLEAAVRTAGSEGALGHGASVAAEQESTAWALYRQLENVPEDDAFRDVLLFMENDPLKRFQLARRLAQAYDRYSVYRPEMLRDWESGRIPPEDDRDARWQALLWAALADAGQTPASGFHTRYLAFRDHPSPASFLAELLPHQRVSVFGLSSLPPAHLDILHRLSGLGLDVHLFQFNPCAEYWGDAASPKRRLRDEARLQDAYGSETARQYALTGHPLLGSWGRVSQEFSTSLIELDETVQADFRGAPEPAAPTLLQRLQLDIQANRDPKAGPAEALTPDGSLAVHVCHGPLREMEVLRENLLALFQADSTLRPGEIAVFLPDVEAYAPAIHSVFGSLPEDHPQHIPYVLADRPATALHPACGAFTALLRLMGGRFPASDVLGLLESEPIRERCGISADDIPRLKDLCREAGAAWGLDAEFREQETGVAFGQNSLRFALDRLLLGAAMSRPADAAGADRFPVLKVGADLLSPAAVPDGQAALVGSFSRFVERLSGFRRKMDRGRGHFPLQEWSVLLAGLADAFFPAEGEDPAGVEEMRRGIRRFDGQVRSAGCAETAASLGVVAQWFDEEWGAAPPGGVLPSGRLVFCTFQPMRTIPLRVIGMAGLNDAAFPRTVHRDGFDLMGPGRKREAGDRSVRDDDRQCFLEVLMSARDRLLISYTGRGDKDNQPVPPSVLVGELSDCVNACFRTDDGRPPFERLSVAHPMHPFSPAYFRPDRPDGLVSFSRPAFQLARLIADRARNGETEADGRDAPAGTPAPAERPASGQDAPPAEVTLRELIRFFLSPCKHWDEQIVGVRPGIRSDEELVEAEPFELGKLGAYSLKNDCLKALEDDGDTDDGTLESWFGAEGRLPVGLAGTGQFRENVRLARSVHERLAEARGGLAPERIDTLLELGGGTRLRARLNGVAGDTLARGRPADMKAKDVLTDWLSHLVFSVHTEGRGRTVGVYEDDSEVEYPPVDAGAARAHLQKVVAWYGEGRRRPLCFWAPSAWEAAKGNTREKALEKAEYAWKNRPRYYEAADASTVRHFGAELPAGVPREEFFQLVQDLFLPAVRKGQGEEEK